MKYVISDVMTITKRQLLQLARIPELLVFSTIQPVMFVLLFRFVFGGSIRMAHFNLLTEQQIKDVMALLLDPESPINK